MISHLAAGDLSQRIAIETATESQDAAGQVNRTWSTLSGCSTLPARVDAVSGGETLRGRQVSSQATFVFTIRYLSTITPEMRVVYGGNYYGILRALDPYGDQREMRIECRDADV